MNFSKIYKGRGFLICTAEDAMQTIVIEELKIKEMKSDKLALFGTKTIKNPKTLYPYGLED